MLRRARSRDGSASGFLFAEPTLDAMHGAIARMLNAYRTPATWQAIQRAGMARDFSWRASATEYVDLYATRDGSRRGDRGALIPGVTTNA